MDYNYKAPQSNYGYNNNSPAYTYSATPSQAIHSAPSGNVTHSETMGTTVDNLAATATGGVNYMLQNDYIRVFIFIVATVYAGYTLLPMPKNLKKMFTNSEIFKYFILFFVAASMLHPLDNTKLKICLVVPVFILLMFRLIRNKSQGKKLFHGIGFRSRDQDCSDSESRSSSRYESRRKSRRGSSSESEGSSDVRTRQERRMGEQSAAGSSGVGLGAVALAGAAGAGVGSLAGAAAVRKGKKDRKSKKGKKGSKKGSKKGKKGKKGSKKGKKGKKSKGSKSDSVKGMTKAEHFSFV